MPYDVDYFLNKFTAIPEDKWCIDRYEDGNGRHCVLGHCGLTLADEWDGCSKISVEEAAALFSLFCSYAKHLFLVFGEYRPDLINDQYIETLNEDQTPKIRILAALDCIKQAVLRNANID